MNNHLVNHALQNVWCNPRQDNQLIIEAKKVSRPGGAVNRLSIMGREITLPSLATRYFVYQFGQINPGVLGLLNPTREWLTDIWQPLITAVNDGKLIANVYTTYGVDIPRKNVYYMITAEKALLVAVLNDTSIPINLVSDSIFFRLYTNAFFQTNRSDNISSPVVCRSKKTLYPVDVLEIQNTLPAYEAMSGHVFKFINGFKTDSINLLNVAMGDTIEFVYDPSVKEVFEFRIGDLPYFTSVLDGLVKYIVHPAKYNNEIQTIDFFDDTDFYVLKKGQDGQYRGFYVNKNVKKHVRMLTHRDYSVSVDIITHVADALKQSLNIPEVDTADLTLQVIVRQSGYQRPLMYDANRIFELYKLPDDDIVRSMTGVDAIVPEWNAVNLERCGYVTLMDCKLSDINYSIMESAYGYNAMAKLLGDTPTRTQIIGNGKLCTVPVGLVNNCTAFEYDSDGYLLGYHVHNNGSPDYYVTSPNTEIVEFISGEGTDQPDVRFGVNNIPVPEYDNYRVYKAPGSNGLVVGEFTDITGTAFYTVVNNVLQVTTPGSDYVLMVRTDSKFFLRNYSPSLVNGHLVLTIQEFQDRGNGVQSYQLPVPLGELDVFLNKRALIHGLDYILDFPRIVIFNKKYLLLNQPDLPEVIVRFTGFNTDGQLDPIDDFGFIRYGLLSSNNRFDLRDDRVMRITYDGKTITRDQITFAEDSSSVSIINGVNGLPYQIKDTVVPMREWSQSNTYDLRSIAQITDTRVSNYMTLKYPEPDRGNLSVIEERYPLYSPFVSCVIQQLLSGSIDLSGYLNGMTDNDILTLCKPYEYLLTTDPIRLDLDPQNVEIHPHHLDVVISLSQIQYRFLMRVVALYADGRINISTFVTIT